MQMEEIEREKSNSNSDITWQLDLTVLDFCNTGMYLLYIMSRHNKDEHSNLSFMPTLSTHGNSSYDIVYEIRKGIEGMQNSWISLNTLSFF